MIGRVGYDFFADHLKASLSAAGVDVSFVHGTKSQPTGVAMIWVDEEGQNSIVVASGANQHSAKRMRRHLPVLKEPNTHYSSWKLLSLRSKLSLALARKLR